MMARLALRGTILAALAMGVADAALAQSLGAIISPGPLSKAHASLEGVGSCTKCHESGRAATVERCLACHAPIARRIAAKTGVHRAVTECASCHAEHRGAKADLRRFDESAFDHAADAAFPLEGGHAAVAGKCSACHKTRSFLAARAACSTCHADVHKAQLGTDCGRCHSARTPFKVTRRTFDHNRTSYVLTGAHRVVDCRKCHSGGRFRELRYGQCSSCHQPHRRTLGPSCTTCHNTGTWTTRLMDHAATGFRLQGAHAQVTCAKCHTSGVAARLQADRCGTCHEDKHKGAFGGTCDACHRQVTFSVTGFTHTRAAGFFGDRHTGITCAKCHVRPPGGTRARAPNASAGAALPSMDCHTCHSDVHFGQVGTACERCHGIDAPKFAASRFSHDRAAFALTGKHQVIACGRCHATETRRYPGGEGTAMRLTQLPSACSECHKDPHLGQIQAQCHTCHTAASFGIFSYKHTGLSRIFNGLHGSVRCQACHKRETGAFPSGRGTTVRFTVPTSCVGCHPRL